VNNRVQQRFDRSIREAVTASEGLAGRQLAERPARARPAISEPTRPKGRLPRMVLLLNPATGGTVLVPWDHPLAAAQRERDAA
jgi:hypothetical protein